VLLWFKFTEMVLQCRPKALLRVLFHRDALRDRRLEHGPTVQEFWGAPQEAEEESMSSARPERRVGTSRAA